MLLAAIFNILETFPVRKHVWIDMYYIVNLARF